jgi:DNA-binding response OmpR family regulator
VKTVLIVDDEPDIVEVMGHLLGDEGYHVVTAANGQQGLERLRDLGEATPDLALIDLMMPILDGREMYLAMRDDVRYRSIPVLLMSAGDGGGVAKELSLELIRKPFAIKALLARMKVIMSRAERDQS